MLEDPVATADVLTRCLTDDVEPAESLRKT